jgi:hypothetical protein
MYSFKYTVSMLVTSLHREVRNVAKKFTIRYALPSGQKAVERDISVPDDANETVVYQTAKRKAPEDKEVREIKYKGTALFRRGRWLRRKAEHKEAFPSRW